MHIICVSSISGGGSGVSQRQLAQRLTERGHTVEILAATRSSRWIRPWYDHQVDLSTRVRTSRLRPFLLALQRPVGRRIRSMPTDDYPTWVAAVPENGYRALARRQRPDVVVASSIERVSWRRLRTVLRIAGIPSVLYIREASGLGHLSVSHAPPDLLLANAQSHATKARELGFECEVVPSVVEFERAITDTAREVVLVVNPIALLGGDRVWPIARARPDIPFVLQESGLLNEDERSALHRLAAAHANVTIRSFSTEPGAMLRDTRVLMVPHRVDNRPRVILEAQANGIPVVASDYPGLVESVGAGGLIVADADATDAWVSALASVWDDHEMYTDLVERARAHAARDEVSPEQIAARFEQLLFGLLRAQGGIAAT